MRKLLLVFSFLFTFTFASEPKHLSAEGKGVMFIFESSTCSYCELLKKDFKENKTMRDLSKDFNIYYISQEKEEDFIVGKTKKKETTTTLRFAFMVKNTPTTIMFDKKWNKIFELPGYAIPSQMGIFMNFVKGINEGKYTSKQWRNYLKDNGIS